MQQIVLNFSLNHIEAISIILDFPFILKLIITAIYIPLSSNRNLMMEQDLRLTDSFQSFILAGDFNSTHPSWHCKSINSFGLKLRRQVDQNFALMTAPSPSFISSNNYLDLTINCNFPYPYSIEMLNDLSSYHLPVILRYQLTLMTQF